MGLKKSDLNDSVPDCSFLGSWHANLLYIDRKKCVLFVNDKTLFNFIAPDVNREQIRNLSDLFRNYLSCVVASEGFPENPQQLIENEYKKTTYSGTNNKSTLGSMTDLVFHYKHHILAEGGVHRAMVPEIIHQLNRMPMGAISYQYPINVLKELYKPTT